jgi:hypothetical protein
MSNSLLVTGMNTSYLYGYSTKPSPNHRLPLPATALLDSGFFGLLMFSSIFFHLSFARAEGSARRGLSGVPAERREPRV